MLTSIYWQAINYIYHAGKVLHNFISAVPLAVIGHTKEDDHTETWVNLYFVDFVANDNFETMLCDFHANVNYSQLNCFFLNFFSNNQRIITMQNKTLCSLLFKNCTDIYMYETGLKDETANKIVEQLDTVDARVKYVVLLAFSIEYLSIVDALVKNPFIFTIKLKSVECCNEQDYFGSILSSNFNHLRNLAIMRSHIDDKKYEQLCKSLFTDRSVISYLKELDISHSNILCTNTIIKSLQSCIIERFIVPNYRINCDLSNSIFLMAYYKENNILNFTMGIPLIIINSIQELDESSTNVSCLKAFLINTAVNERTINLITDVSQYNISDYNLFVRNNMLLCNFNSVLSVFEQLMQKIIRFTLFGTDLADKMALKMVQHLTTAVKTNSKYFLASETKVLTNVTNIKTISGSLGYDDDDDAVTLSVLNELTGMFCKSLSYSENLLKYIKCLDLSSHGLLSTCVKLIVDSLIFCCVEKLILMNDNKVMKSIKNYILCAYFEGKRMCNTISRIPLTIIGKGGIYCQGISINVYLVEILATEEVLESIILEEWYDHLQYIFLNSMQNTTILPSQILSHACMKLFNSLILFESGLQDEQTLTIAEQLRTLNKQVQYMLVSNTILLARKADMWSISKALNNNPLITVVKLTNCIISTIEFGSFFTAKLKYLKWFSLTQCTICGTTIKDIPKCNTFFTTGATIPYLKQLDLSMSNLALECVSILTTALLSCIVERIILSDDRIYDELIHAVFLQTYCKNVYIVNFVMGIPLIIINGIKRMKSFIHYFTIFLMNTVLNDIINQITDLSGYNVYDYNLILLKNNVLANFHNVLPLFKCSLSKVTNFTLFGSNLMKETAVKIVAFLNEISDVNIEFSLICKDTSLNKTIHFGPIMQTLANSKLHNSRFAILLLPLTLVSCVELFDISGCSISNKDFMTLQEFLIQFHITIEILNISYNEVSPIALSKAIVDFHIRKLYLHGESFPVQDTLTMLLPKLINIKYNLEIKFAESTSFILCHIQFNINDILKTAQNLLHLFVMNCKQYDFLDVIVPILTQFPLDVLSSVHLYNNSVKYQDIVKAVDELTQVNLFIEEKDFKFHSAQSVKNDFSNMNSIVYSTSEHSSNLQMQWTPPTKMKFVNFHFKELTMINVGVMITQKFLRDKYLQRIKIANFQVTDDAAKVIGTIFGNSHNLEHLELVNLCISDNTLMTVLQLLRKLYSLRHLTLRLINMSSDKSACGLVYVIANNKSLEYLEISQCNLKESVIVEIVAAIKDIKLLKRLNLSNNIITNVAASKLASVLNKTTTSLTHLDLSSTKLQEAGIIDITRGLNNSNLGYLFLNNCNITRNAAAEIASCIKEHFTSLIHLELSNCKLEEASLLCITKALANMSSLLKLNIKFNAITKAAAVDLSKVIKNNSEMTNLKLTVSDTSLVEVASSCRTLSSIKCIDWNFSLFKMNSKYLASKFCLKDIIFKINIDDELDADDPYSSIERDIKEITHLTFTNCSCAEVFNCIESLLSLQHLDVNSSTIAYDVISNTIQKNIALSHINISNCCWQRSFNKVDCFKTPNSQPIWYIEEELYEPLKMAFVEEKLYEPLKLEFVEKKLCANFPCKVKYVEKKHYNYPTTVEYVEDKLYEDLLFKVEFAVNEEELYDFPHKVENSIYNDSPLEDYMFYEIAKSLSSLQQLEYLNISGNKITYSIACDIATTIHNNRRLQHLDMSNCQAQTTELLIIFESLENLNDLSYLNFSNNYFCFQANDVTGNINCNLPNVVNANEHLNFLLLSTVDESGQLLEKIVQPSKALKYLDISHNAVTDDAANNLSSIIAEHESLQYLNMNGCIISKHGNKCVTKSIANVAHLQYNIESNCYDGIIHAAVFSNFKLFIFLTYDSKALSSCIPFNVVKSMYYINFASQCLTKEVLHSISTAFSTANIKSLTFINCDFEECNILSILQLTKHIKTLKYFILNSFRMSEEALGDIAQTICNNMNISYLDLSDSKLSGSQFSIIAKALSKLSALQYLDISQNEILDEVAFEIAFVIINNTSLEYLNLSNCVLSDIGIQFICNSSARASSLRALNISGNHITTQAAKNIAAALSCYDAKTMSSKTFRSKLFLHKYSVIEYLNISDCSLSVSDLLIVLSALKNIKSLKYLNLGRNEVDENTTHVLGSLIQNNHKLHSLFIPSCDTSGFLLEKIISQCTTLKYLDISCNTINNCAADNLSCFISSRSLQCVNISHCTMVESGNKVLMNTIANVANLQLRVIQDVFLQSIVAAVLSDFVLFIFLLNDECIHSKCESLSAIKPMYYVNLSCITMEVKDCVASAFLMTHIVYLNFNNCDLGEDNAFVMVQAVEHINTLQYLTLKSSRIHKEALDNIVLIILNNTDMKHIDISDCELCGSEVAVIAKAISKLSALQFLDISRNEVTDEAAVEVASVITNNASLQYLNLSGCDIKDFGIHIISDALAQIKTLLSFNISENHITSNTAKDVAPVVSSNIGLQNICFSNCFTEDETFMIVSCIYKQLKTLKHLNLEGNVINDQTAEDLVALLTVNALQYLNISNCNTSDLGMHKILSALEDNEILEYLNLSCNKVNGRLTEDIKSFMKRVCTLQQLHLSNCKLSQFQVMSFVTVALTSPCSVQHLDLSFNCEAEILPIKFNYTQQQQQLIKNDGLCYLNLCCCGLTDKDMCNVLSMLSMCTSLNYLNLGSCTIPGGISVGSVITNNKSLKYLNLSDCALQKDEIIVVAKSLSVATSIECLLLSSNVITYRAAKEISSAIYNIPSLKQLSLSDCELEDLGLCYITNALEQISSLQQLDLSYNIISDKAAVGIASALSSNTSLEYLDMSYCTWPNNGLAIIRMMIDHKKFRMLKEVDFTTL